MSIGMAFALARYWAGREDELLRAHVHTKTATEEERETYFRDIARRVLAGEPIPPPVQRLLEYEREVTEAELEVHQSVTEFDFCICGGTFVPDPKRKKGRKGKRACGWCSQPEGKPQSFHERTGKPHQNLLLPQHRVSDPIASLSASVRSGASVGSDSSPIPSARPGKAATARIKSQ